MAAPLPRFQFRLWGKKKEEVATSDDDDSSSDWGYGPRKPETVKLASASARRMRKKWQRREEMRVDREHDIVLVPSDGGCLSGSESDDSDWSIGWLEPHASDFLSEDDVEDDDDSFAVLVPCYRFHNNKGLPVEPSRNQLFATPNNHFTGNKKMLQRAASNAYSWWVAGHIRTKQSKWLEQSLQDMEEKVAAVMKLISEDGDSFAKRAEMYYKKRPELLNFVEESFRAYRGLAERYDHLSKELQNANNTLASAFPDQFQFIMDDDDDDDDDDDMDSSKMPRKGLYNQKHNMNVPSITKQFPTRNIKAIMALASKTNNNNSSQGPKKGERRPGNKVVEALRSGYDKAQAVQEIDKLQKSILTKQTEKEFTKSSYESRVTKYMEIEKEITEMQEKVLVLQEEFGVGKAIEDNEARTLMLEAALKSCQDALAELQEKQAKSDAEVKQERERISSAREKILSFKGEFNLSGGDDDQSEQPLREESLVKFDDEANTRTSQAKEIEMLRDKMKEHFEGDSSLSMSDMVERIDELVNKVISMESGVASQTAMINRMKVESDELQTHIQSLEDDKANLIDGKNVLTDRLKEMEQKLRGVQDLDHRVESKNNSLQTQFIEASSNVHMISQKLPHLNLDEEETEEIQGNQEQFVAEENDGHGKAILPNPQHVESNNSNREVKSPHSVRFIEPKDASQHPTVDGVPISQQEHTLRDQSEKPMNESQADEMEVAKQREDERNWEKEYTSVLHNYKEVKMKLEEVEHKSEDSLTELKELENAIAKKDEEIQSLQQKLILMQKKMEEYKNIKETNGCPLEHVHDKDDITIESRQVEEERELRELENVIANKDAEIQSLQQKLILLRKKLDEYKNMKETNGCPLEHVHEKDDVFIKLIQVEEEREMSPAEAKLRADIDEILEENLDFWIRFSSSFAEIQKFQSQVEDLQKDLEKVDQHKKKREVSDEIGPSLKSDSRAIYRHLKEIQTELTVWLQQSMGLRAELHRRFSQLCNIQEQISKALNDGAIDEQMRFTSLQAAKFQGEVLNMQQENNRVADELQASLDSVTTLQIHIEKTIDKLNGELGLSGSKSQSSPQFRQTGTRNQVPLRSFIFGVKPKKQKQSFFSCVHPGFHKRY
ncbi:hypothetical protein V2J09_021674 [Rumex salicifolius]